eukprot:TRINITY_DN37132_c0_g1_i1.p1 TRINITY_DN37132_c0_g1~~TRINITY_DN37132_c0_g1_i1.p1  ORF type:complete len:497 (-),score=127.76 TRINITY_DN37132_c0_g1_i1:46-1536(-)
MLQLPPEPRRSRAAEVAREEGIAFRNAEAPASSRTRTALEDVLEARRVRRAKEQEQQRRLHRERALEVAVAKAITPRRSDHHVPAHEVMIASLEQGSHTFWQRHGFGRLSRRRVQGLAADETLSPVAKPSYKASWDAAQDMARRAPAHVNDAIQAVLEGPGGTEAPKFATPRLKPPKGELYFDSYEVPGDWTDPQVAGFNSMTAGAHRQHKWEHQHQYFPMALKDEAARVEHVFGFDEEDAMMASGALKLEAAAGGGAGIAKRLLSTQDASGQPSWRELFALAPRAEAACFEMPKETALHVALCLEHAARAAEAEALGRAAAAASLEIPFIQDAEEAADSEAAEGLLRAEAAARLRQAAVALLAASATRARDAHSYDFPMAGLEALVSTGLGWAAFSDMFLASLFAQLQRMSSMQPQVRRMVTMEPSIAKRLKSVFIAAFEQGEGQLELGPAGRNLAAAARHALSEACALDEHSGALLVKLSSRGEHPKLPNMALL